MYNIFFFSFNLIEIQINMTQNNILKIFPFIKIGQNLAFKKMGYTLNIFYKLI